MKSIIYFSLVASLVGLGACSKQAGGDVSPSNDKTQAGVVKGHVVDTQGRPIAGAKIIANSANYFNDTNMGFTDANGNYKISLPNGPMAGAFYVRGSVQVKFEGKVYQLPLFTEDDGTFTPDEGAVKNLQLKLSGERTGNFGDDGLYGGTVEITNRTDSPYLRLADVEFTMEPLGLIDDTKGETLTFHADGYVITAKGIPIGKYRVSARHIPTNKPLRIRVMDSNTAYQSSVTTTFQSNYYIDSIYEMHFEVAN
jgi:hypothetical protein